MELKDWHLPSMYYQLKEEAKYERKRREIDEFNAQNRWRKRGLSIIPTKCVYYLSYIAQKRTI